MQPLEPEKHASEMHQAFTAAAEAWLRRTRNPQADMAAFDAVQRWQEHEDDVQSAANTLADNETPAASTPADDGTPPVLSPAVVRTACLVKIQGQQKSETWVLPNDRPVLIGRSGKSASPVDIDLWPDESVSRRHAVIWFDGKEWRIEDLRSKNGTLLGEYNIRGQRSMRLEPGARLQAGRTILQFTALENADEPSAERREAAVP